MKKRLRFGRWIAGALFICLAVFSMLGTKPRLSGGSRLPRGEVEPQLVSAWQGRAYLIAPDGSLWKWGSQNRFFKGQNVQDSETPVRFGDGSDWRKIAARSSHGLALKKDGTLWGWGLNASRRKTADWTEHVDRPVRVGDADDWMDISVGETHCLALKRNGTLWTWGRNNRGQLGTGTKNDRSSFFTRQVEPVETSPIDKRGNVMWPFEPGYRPLQITEDTDWKSISAGAWNCYALKDDGSLWVWGMDPSGAGGTNDLLVPTLTGSDTNWLSVSVGGFHVVALKTDGSLWLSGANVHYVAGGYVTGPIDGFVQMGDDTDWVEAHSGYNGIMARKADQSWWVCGDNSRGQLGLNAKTRGGRVGVLTPRNPSPGLSTFSGEVQTAHLLNSERSGLTR